MNIWRWGLEDDPGHLYARILGVVFPFVVRSGTKGNPSYDVGHVTTEGSGLPDIPTFFQVDSVHLKPGGPQQAFPYGVAVESDH